ncbi:hypothetical protein AB0L57_30245 [Nocardia sp. NPDC052254]|uniref:hypothetical protein n=1 Tax=Nocardia sp. NPDC052254 TaxID=3155681 RepID=UPI003421A240
MSEPTSPPPVPRPQSAAEPDQTWGAPQTAPPATWSTKRSLAAVGIAVVIAAAGGGIVYAATHSSGNGNGHGPGGGPGMSWGGGHNSAGPGGMNSAGPGGMDSAGPSLHGQFVISDGNGGYTTELTQTGTVTAVSDTSITAKSADDFSQTYTLADSTRKSAVKVGDTVRIQATQANGTATATTVTSGTESGPMADGGAGRMSRPGAMIPGGPGQNGNAPGQNAGPGMAPPVDGAAPNQPGN